MINSNINPRYDCKKTKVEQISSLKAFEFDFEAGYDFTLMKLYLLK